MLTQIVYQVNVAYRRINPYYEGLATEENFHFIFLSQYLEQIDTKREQLDVIYASGDLRCLDAVLNTMYHLLLG